MLKNPKSFILVKRVYFLLIFSVLVFSAYHVGYAKKIIPGVKIGEVFVGGMTYDEAHRELIKYLEILDTSLILSHEGIKHEITGESVSLSYDVDASVSRAFELGRTGNVFVDTKDKIASLVKTVRVKAHYDWDEEGLGAEFSQIRGKINQVAAEPEFSFDDIGRIVINDAVTGKKVSEQKMYDLVMNVFDLFEFGAKEIPVSVMEPKLMVSDLQKVEEQVKKIALGSLNIIHGEMNWRITPQQALNFIEVVSKPSGAVILALNRANFDSYLGLLEQDINRLPRGKVTKEEDGVVVGFELVQAGEELNERDFTEDFEEALLGDSTEVEVSTITVSDLGDPSRYGIFTLLGEGQSNYSGSAVERSHNLTLAAERTDGVLVPPGGIYSFNNSVGEISGATGYDTAYIIANGRTVLGEGGGVCQTSTTLFRAVLDSGLPIVTRHPHAYRVYYYEQDMPVGFDASVYQPSLDFKFENDSPNYVLVQSSWDSSEKILTFKLFGTPDGRSVEITEPVVGNISSPPEPLYQEDPSLPKGVVKQVDFAAWGATSQFSRTVTKNGETLHVDNFTSSYQPWRAVYLVGTN